MGLFRRDVHHPLHHVAGLGLGQDSDSLRCHQLRNHVDRNVWHAWIFLVIQITQDRG